MNGIAHIMLKPGNYDIMIKNIYTCFKYGTIFANTEPNSFAPPYILLKRQYILLIYKKDIHISNTKPIIVYLKKKMSITPKKKSKTGTLFYFKNIRRRNQYSWMSYWVEKSKCCLKTN